MPPIPIESRRRHTAANLAALTLANAFIFQEQLANADPRVEPIRRLLTNRDFHGATAKHWKFICDTINYIPIFHLAHEILVAIPAGADTAKALRVLAQHALDIVSERAALRHDLMGRVYHYLLLEAKYLGTFYTSVPAATLLLKLALSPARWKIDWTDTETIRKFLVADLACGTGTLLMAASQAITDNFVRACVQGRKPVDGDALRDLHQVIMEDVLHGYDVLPSAVHLTASTLALLAPEIAFKKMQLYVMPMGKLPDDKIYLGSIEYLSKDTVGTQLDLMGQIAAGGAAAAMGGAGAAASFAPLPLVDLCVMNPPFVRSVNSNLLFGSMPQWRREMQDELRRRLRPARGQEILATTTAGLASVFAAIGDKHLKSDGRLALVLPAAVTTGGAWDKTRILIDGGYELEFVVASHDAARWAFSENTDLSEVLVVARKKRLTERRDDSKEKTCTFINLWRNPTATADALALGESIEASNPAPLGSAARLLHGTTNLMIGAEKWGELISIPLHELWGNPWLGSAFAHTELVRANWHLRQGKLVLPGARTGHDIPLCTLQALGELGPDGRDIHDGFTHGPTRTGYAAFWNHDADAVVTITQVPNQFLSPRSRPASGRPRRPASLLWPRASHLMVAVRLRFNTHKLVAIRLSEKGLSNVWYPLKLADDNESHEKALLIWLNSSLGILLVAGHRVPTQGAWVQFKKPTWNPMPVLDVRKLSKQQLHQLSVGYDAIAQHELSPFPKMDVDPVRQEIDDLLSHVLQLPSLAPIRAILAREPIINDKPLWEAGRHEQLGDTGEQFELLLPVNHNK